MRSTSPPLWHTAVVVGASSGIGAVLAGRIARAGTRVALVARRAEVLRRLADEIDPTGERVRAYAHDVREAGTVPDVLAAVDRDLGRPDCVVYAAGIMPHIDRATWRTEIDHEIVDVNLRGAMAWLNPVAVRFEARRGGTIVGISSVAGDRGRRAYPAYAASKAGLTAYLESLRNRLAPHGVRVLTVKPGPVATPMTAGLDRLPFLVSAERAADLIMRAAGRGTSTVYVPERWRVVMAMLRMIPSVVFRRLDV
jgi:decaprenylphospho-beta-D-erythro-pentofuranosid-2-ulose 2-reductase